MPPAPFVEDGQGPVLAGGAHAQVLVLDGVAGLVHASRRRAGGGLDAQGPVAERRDVRRDEAGGDPLAAVARRVEPALDRLEGDAAAVAVGEGDGEASGLGREPDGDEIAAGAAVGVEDDDGAFGRSGAAGDVALRFEEHGLADLLDLVEPLADVVVHGVH